MEFLAITFAIAALSLLTIIIPAILWLTISTWAALGWIVAVAAVLRLLGYNSGNNCIITHEAASSFQQALVNEHREVSECQ